MGIQEIVAGAFVKMLKGRTDLVFLEGGIASNCIYFVPKRLSALAGNSHNHHDNPICFWILLDDEKETIYLMVGENPEQRNKGIRISTPHISWVGASNIDLGAHQEWRWNLKSKHAEQSWKNLKLEKDKQKQESMADDIANTFACLYLSILNEIILTNIHSNLH